ncbi:MAG: C25 family cysteine peptidase [bacterium]|nr:C25 family cysteine peptidase [bacterium]
MITLCRITGIVGLMLLFGFSSALADYLPLREDVTSEAPQTILLKNDANLVQIEIRIPGVEIFQGTLEGHNWDRISIAGGGFSSELGAPELATYSRLIAIPATAAVHADMEILESETIPNIDLMPAQGREPEAMAQESQPVQFDMAAYSTDGFYGENMTAVSEPALCRGVRLVAVTTNPISYNPATREVQVAHRYRVNIHFEGTDLRNVPTRAIRPMSHSWAKIMRAMVANFDELDVVEVPMGSYLIIAQNNTDLLNRLAPLVEWKKRKGHSVTLSTFSAGASTTTIKNLIQTAYNTWDIPPEFVLLFGDTSGSYSLAGYSITDPFYGGNYDVDHQYTQLDGTDILSDVALGRLPASTSSEADMMVAKNLFYEKMPYTTNSNWFHQGMVSAQTSILSAKQVAHWVKTRFIEHNYTRVDTMWFSSFNSSTFLSSMSAGMCYYEERSWGSGVPTYTIDQMQNGRMLPFVVNLTCGTGGFQSDSQMEHFVSVGTAISPRGAIACVGTATQGTNTRFNNTITMGLFASLFLEDNPYAGDALVYGKLMMYNCYQTWEAQNVTWFSQWNALAGDPGVDLFTHAIRNITCVVPDNVTWGVNSLTLTVNEGSQPVPEATVCFYKANELQTVGETNENGQITLPIGVATAGNVKVTVTKHDFYPIVDSLDVVQAGVAVGYLSNTVDDDNSGSSSGDGDGFINPGETVELPLVFKNFGSTTIATNISVTATESDPYATLTDSIETFTDMAPGATGSSADDFDLQVAPDCPNGHMIRLNHVTTATQGSWNGLIDLTVRSFDMKILNAQAMGSDTLIAPNETSNLVLTVKNIGNKNASNLTATITSLSNFLVVNDNSASFGTVNIDATANCGGNPFNLTAIGTTPPGQKAKLKVVFTSATGATQTDTITLQLGLKSLTDPQGPDAYGYYCFDNTDVNYAQCPTYNWVEVSSIGTQLSINDPSEEDDQSVNVTLPFTFRYYGQNVNNITVCSNGWLATHSNISFTDFRNYPIPSAIGPNGMIAGFWDDLVTTSTGKVYTYNDVSNHRFIIAWSHVRIFNSYGNEQDFEIMLYDPAYTPTPTGDGEIVFQYNIVNESPGQNDDNKYSTVGIESPDQSDGIQVVYWNTYSDPAAAHLQTGRAYKFSTAFTYGTPPLNFNINTSPISPPVVIPANGGSFPYNINVHNLGSTPGTITLWNKVRDASNVYTTVFGPITRTLPGGANPARVFTQTIAGSISSGTLYFISYIGMYPNTIADSNFFTITKSTVADGKPWIAESYVTGDFFDEFAVTNSSVPTEYSLGQNYPNPFNPLTSISFNLTQAGLVKLTIFDVMGREVATLVNGTREAGTHEVTFDGSGLASGIYLYKLEAGEFRATQKMVLLK